MCPVLLSGGVPGDVGSDRELSRAVSAAFHVARFRSSP